MLYTLLPPILVVLSLIGIIVFLLKKAHRVAGVAGSDRKVALDNSERRVSAGGVDDGHDGIGGAVKAKFLVSLEKMIRKIRLMFLKLENVFKAWSESLKEKRKERSENIAKKEEIRDKQQDAIEKINNYAPEKKAFNERLFRRKPVLPEEEKIIRPLIKEGYQRPREVVETKNQLEKILIERIAANPKDTEAYERLGEYYFEIENYDHSKECYKQVMKLNPRNIGVRSRMKKLERLLGR